MSDEFSKFAELTYRAKYSHEGKEDWQHIAWRTATETFSKVDAPKSLVEECAKEIEARVLMPGGRYLYACGRPVHQTNNCVLFRASDSREGWAELLHKSAMSLMTGAGIGVVYSDVRAEGSVIRGTGGRATGPLALMQILNEAGRGIMQGGSRRSAIWAGLNWNHPDIFKFIHLKNWDAAVRKLKLNDYNFPATMDMTNISVMLDDAFFEAYGDEGHPDHCHAGKVYWVTVERMLRTSEPGFSIDVGENAGENLRNAPVSGDTYVLTGTGYQKVRDTLDGEISIWTGQQWADTRFYRTKEYTQVVRVNMTGGRSLVCDPEHEILIERHKGVGTRRKVDHIDRVPAADLAAGDIVHVSMATHSGEERETHGTWYTLGFLYGDGTFHKNNSAEVTLCTKEKETCGDSFDSDLIRRSSVDSRGYTRMYMHIHELFKNRCKEVFPQDVFSLAALQRAEFLAGLFDSDGNWLESQSAIRLSSIHREFLVGARRLLESLEIRSVISTGGHSGYSGVLGWLLRIATEDVEKFRITIPTQRVVPKEGVTSYRPHMVKVLSVEDAGREDVFCCDVGVDDHSFQAEGIIISNCCELTSSDDNDVCNLLSPNLARIHDHKTMAKACRLSAAFCVAGSVYSDLPCEEIRPVREKNRRIGVGLMGFHEWLLIRGKKYGPDANLEEYLEIYADQTPRAANMWADEWHLSRPVKTRAIAPNGTIGIVAGPTTAGIEPLFCAAYKRRYLVGKAWYEEYVIEPIAQRLIDEGMDPSDIEDAYSIDVEKRLEFQAWVQKYVDHGISSTINLPAWGSEKNNKQTVQKYGNLFLKYLPKLRGLTCYADGSRSGQPLTPVTYEEAKKHNVKYESIDICKLTKGGESCGD